MKRKSNLCTTFYFIAIIFPYFFTCTQVKVFTNIRFFFCLNSNTQNRGIYDLCFISKHCVSFSLWTSKYWLLFSRVGMFLLRVGKPFMLCTLLFGEWINKFDMVPIFNLKVARVGNWDLSYLSVKYWGITKWR